MSTDTQKIHSLDSEEDEEEEENGEDPLKNFNLVTEEFRDIPSFIFGKYFEKRCDSEHEFRKLINKVVENGNELLYLYESSDEKNESKKRIKEFLDILDNILIKLIQTFQLPAKIDLIKQFYMNNDLQQYQDLIQRDFYPDVENIPNEFSSNKRLDLEELFQDFNPNKNEGQIDFDKFELIKPPDNLYKQFSDKSTREDNLHKYDKYLCVVNSILSIHKLQKFSDIYKKNDEECNHQEKLLTKEALAKLDPDDVSKARKSLLKIHKNKNQPKNEASAPPDSEEVSLLKQQNRILRKEVKHLKQQIIEFEQKNQQDDLEIERLKQRIIGFEQKNQQENLESKSKQATELQLANQKLTKDNEKYKKLFKEASKNEDYICQINQLNDKIKSLTKEKEKMQKLYDNSQAEIQKFKDRILTQDEDDEEEESVEDPLKNFNLVTKEIQGFPSFIFSKYYENRSDSEHEFRKLINNVVENGSELLYLYESSDEKNESKTRIKEFLDTLDDTISDLTQTYQLPGRIELIKQFYMKNDLQQYQDLIQRDFYPDVENIPNEFSSNKRLNLKELFQDFNPNKNEGQIDFDKFELIKPPDNLYKQFSDKSTREDNLHKYDKYLCVVNSILSIHKLQEFSDIYKKNDEECNHQEKLLTKEALAKLNPDDVSKARNSLLKSKKTNKLTYPTGDLTKDNVLLLEKNTKLKKQKNKIKNMYNELHDEYKELKQKYYSMEDTNTQLHQEIESISNEKKSIKESNNALKHQSNMLRYQIKSFERQITDLNKQIKILKDKKYPIASTTKKLNDPERKSPDLIKTEQPTSKDAHIPVQEPSNSQLVYKLKETISKLTDSVDELKFENKAIKDEINELNQEKVKWKNEKKNYEEYFNQIKQRHNQEQQENSELIRAKANTESGKKKDEIQIDKTKHGFNQEQKENGELSQANENIGNKKKNSDEYFNHSQQKNSEMKQRHNQEQQENGELSQANENTGNGKKNSDEYFNHSQQKNGEMKQRHNQPQQENSELIRAKENSESGNKKYEIQFNKTNQGFNQEQKENGELSQANENTGNGKKNSEEYCNQVKPKSNRSQQKNSEMKQRHNQPQQENNELIRASASSENETKKYKIHINKANQRLNQEQQENGELIPSNAKSENGNKKYKIHINKTNQGLNQEQQENGELSQANENTGNEKKNSEEYFNQIKPKYQRSQLKKYETIISSNKT